MNIEADLKLCNEIVEQYRKMTYENIEGAFELSQMSISVYDRINEIRLQVSTLDKSALGKYTKSDLKEYLRSKMKLMEYIHVQSRAIYVAATYDSQNILKELNGEYIIEGEGEKTYREFVEYKLGEREINSIRSLYYKADGEVISNGKRPLMNMNELIFPYEEDENLDNKIVYYEASRGCPFNSKTI